VHLLSGYLLRFIKFACSDFKTCTLNCALLACAVLFHIMQVKGIFEVEVVGDQELDSVYNCSDVAVYRLRRRGPAGEGSGRVASPQVLASSSTPHAANAAAALQRQNIQHQTTEESAVYATVGQDGSSKRPRKR
jgi:hypothetical protein